MKRFLQIILPVLALIAVFVFFGVLPRIRNQQELKAASDETTNRVQLVSVVTVKAIGDTNGLTLPGQISPYRETNLYARTQGFVRKRFVDLGSIVRRGQLLATVEAPEIEQDVVRAQADLQFARANLTRVQSVTLPGAIAQQDIDTRQSAVNVGQAGLRRIQALRSLQEVHAPFNGMITARNAEVGNLVQAGTGMALFTLSQLDTLRVYVDVPQTYYQAIKIGMPAVVTVPEMKGRMFTGKVVRTSGTLRTQTRTLLVEVAIPNQKRELVAGLYGNVKFPAKITNPPVVIPANTLMVTPEGPRVVLITPNNVVKITPVTLGRDFGTSLEVVGGLSGNERLVSNPTDQLADNAVVRIRVDKPAEKK